MDYLMQKISNLPSDKYGAWEPCYDISPEAKRWAKRFALYRLRSLIRSFLAEYDIVIVRDLEIIEFNVWLDCNTCIADDPYTWGWKCRFILGNK